MTFAPRILIDERGAAMVEAAIAVTLLLVLTLGFVDFGYAYYQWNAASKAVQIGARTAAVSGPVSGAIAGAATPLDPMQAGVGMPAGTFVYSCTGAGTCTNGSTFNQSNFTYIYSRMAAFFPGLQPSQVRITYAATGLGYWSRPGGPVPTITVSLQDVKFRFFFLSGLMGFNEIAMPSMLSTVTGEDLKSTAP